jgi:hypothetical protein
MVQHVPTQARPAKMQEERPTHVAARSWSAVRPEEVPVGCTFNPRTGKIYQLAPGKERSEEYLRLTRNYEAARVAVVTYGNDNHIIYDIESKAGFQVQPDQSRRWLHPGDDPVYDGLLKSAAKAKEALNGYKNNHKDEFRPLPQGRKNLSARPTMQVVGLPKKAPSQQ